MSTDSGLAYEPLVLTTRTGRFTLHYPRSERDIEPYRLAMIAPHTLAHLPTFSSDFPAEEAAEVTAAHARDASRMNLDIHDAATGEWLGVAGMLRMVDAPATAAHPARRTAEGGMILGVSGLGKGCVSDTWLSVLTHAFQPVPAGLGLTHAAFATGSHNTAMRGWLEKVLRLEPLTEDALTEEQKQSRKEWGEEGLQFYLMSEPEWQERKAELEKRLDARK